LRDIKEQIKGDLIDYLIKFEQIKDEINKSSSYMTGDEDDSDSGKLGLTTRSPMNQTILPKNYKSDTQLLAEFDSKRILRKHGTATHSDGLITPKKMKKQTKQANQLENFALLPNL
jgi:hypothetical protein